MAVLTEPERFAIWQAYMADEQSVHGTLTKADIRAAVNALDDFFDTNAAAINSAIPLPARSVLTASQKARIARYVIAKRYP